MPRLGRIQLPRWSPGTERALTTVAFGATGARPKAYLQAALHADEWPGMLVLHELRRRLNELEAREAILGEVVLVPVANPIGLGQSVLGVTAGRYALSGAGNFNRHYPDLADAVAERVGHGPGHGPGDRLGPDPQANVALIRDSIRAVLEARSPQDETQFLRESLMRLAADADIVLDLHCDSDAVLHVYTSASLWPGASDLSADLGAEVTLLAQVSGGNPFDESMSGIWWSLAQRFPEVPIPLACLAATIELRGQDDVHEEVAAADAENLLRFLTRRGLIAGEPMPLPALRAPATPLAGVDILRAPSAGLVSYFKAPGQWVEAGELLAHLTDPELPPGSATSGDDPSRVAIRAGIEGRIFARSRERFVRPNQVIFTIAGAQALPGREGPLLTD